MYGSKNDVDVPNFGNYGHDGSEVEKERCATVQRNNSESFWNTDEFANSLMSNPDILIISLGACDAVDGNWNEDSEVMFKQDYKALLQTYQGLYTKPEIYVMTPPPSVNNADPPKNSTITN